MAPPLKPQATLPPPTRRRRHQHAPSSRPRERTYSTSQDTTSTSTSAPGLLSAPTPSPSAATTGPSNCFFPDGSEGGALVLLLKLLTKNAAARASCAFRFHNPATGAASARWSVPLLHYRSGLVNKRAQVSTFRWNVLMYAHDDRLTVECAVTVVHEPKVSETKAVFAVEEPPSEQSEHLGRILEEEGCDVTFDVQGEVFTAPKIVLGMRSPVFKEKFYGPEMEKG
ncbi:uncharacterized protein LOC101764240 [Setaria italica]|uniref:uncharacterized protein LOC101764240 n=1 Tax=Setaria italica TaxID=4555 RepID=UPI0003512AF5|nr:uncharacterized protein LOC101764240 [Setaria italica]